MVRYQKIIVYDAPPSMECFKKEHLLPHVPCIIRGCTVGLKIQKWDLQYIEEKCGDNKVFCRSQTNCDKYKSGVEYSVRQTTVKEYLSDLRQQNSRSKNSYLAVQNVNHFLPQLIPDIDLPPYIENLHSGPFVWIARKNHYEYMHVDPDEGFLMILHGHKTVRLFSYTHLEKLKPRPRGAQGRTIQSQVDLNDQETMDKLDVTCLTGELGSTDALYIPGLFWHQITTDDENTVSVNTFWGQNPELNGGVSFSKRAIQPAGLTKSIHSNPALHNIFKYWFTNVLEQNRHYPIFNRQLSRWRQVLFHFIIKQWKEKISEEEIDVLVDITKEYLQISEFPERAPDDTSKYPPILKIRGLLHREEQNKIRT